jgi:hypothetical protein
MTNRVRTERQEKARDAESSAARDVAPPEQTPMDKFKSLAKRLLNVTKEEIQEQTRRHARK